MTSIAGMMQSHVTRARGRKIRKRPFIPKSSWAMRRCETRRYLLPRSSRWWKSTKVIDR